ncbi:MAG TPA: imelysin family protein, partial [Thauera aminoaromatica]|nr:imelysin family protein [Thauera aminoaromatica]
MRFRPIAVALLTATLTLPAMAQQAPAPRDVLTHYAELVHAGYADSAASARTLKLAIDAFTRAPSEEGLREARARWLAA